VYAAVGLALFSIVLMVAPAQGASGPSFRSGVHAGLLPAHAGGLTPAGAVTAPSATLLSSLALGVDVSPHSICAFQTNTCSAGVAQARVTLSAQAIGNGVTSWPDVQVAFVMETTLFDGVYDPSAQEYGQSPCTQGGGMPCEESNGVPFFIVHAQQIGNAIAAANPHSHVSFALVDYFATIDQFDDGDGSEYHVDIQNFVASQYFGSEVASTFQAKTLGGGFVYGDSDFSDNILHSSVITALYGTIIGSGLGWTNNTHHVIVWMGSTVPRDPNYSVNYCVTPSTFSGGANCYSPTCEPSYAFQNGISPNCEGWIHSQDGNVTHSIAALAHTAPACTQSIGGVCTVDAIDYWDSMTDPYSKDWPTGRPGGGPGGIKVQADTAKVLLAGCDLAAATGGTWDGPAFFTCPDGQSGSLQYVSHGPADKPNTNNPTLFLALRQVGFGPVVETQTAAGSGKPIFQFVSFGSIIVAGGSSLQPTAACARNGVTLRTCQLVPSITHFGGREVLGWNWSTNASANIMYVGDQWTASFNVVATGPPYQTVPVDACITITCHVGGSTAIGGIFTWANFVPYTNNSVVTVSFPLGSVTVVFTPPPLGPSAPPPPPPPLPPGIPVPAPTAVPVLTQLGIGNTVGVGNVSLQGVAAGFLGAGFMRVGIKNRPVAMKVAAKSGLMTSKFDREGINKSASAVGHFE
jgi:hypothetical protein